MNTARRKSTAEETSLKNVKHHMCVEQAH